MTALIDLVGLHTPPSTDSDRVNRLVHPSMRAHALYEDDLLVLADWIATGVDPSFLMGVRLDGRQYRRVLHTSSVEAWLIAWGPSTFLGLHDHGGSRSAFQVVAGLLEERSTNLDSHALLATVPLRAGGRRNVAPRDVHGVWNPAETTALSVHVYSPPLESMNFYAHEKAHFLEKLGTEREIDWTGH